MRTALKGLVGLLLMVAVSGCCCFGDPAYNTCWTTAPNAAVAGNMTPPQVTMQ